MFRKLKIFIFLSLVLTLALSACAPAATDTAPESEEPAVVEEAPATPVEEEDSPAIPEVTELILATTTSTRDSGLLDMLLPIFEERSGYVVKMVAVGTGQALAMGEEGNADVLLVHAPSAEEEFMKNGFGSERYLVMHNDFVIVGPSDDPVGISGTPLAVDALAKIAAAEATFVTRGDDSGTNKMEISLWGQAGIVPEGDWYLETGQGMGDTLRITSEEFGYTLTDRATYLAQRENLELDIMVEGDAVLLNIYHVMVVNPELWPGVNTAGAVAFAEFLVAEDIQDIIATFGIEQYGQPLFFPDAGKTE
ncbi:MAG: substrate-binding domain-containing protein [Anaerolineaceae bacterium]|nr:substrate-binding domain-containing protein [Anaerolineaceae bacterium]